MGSLEVAETAKWQRSYTSCQTTRDPLVSQTATEQNIQWATANRLSVTCWTWRAVGSVFFIADFATAKIFDRISVRYVGQHIQDLQDCLEAFVFICL